MLPGLHPISGEVQSKAKQTRRKWSEVWGLWALGFSTRSPQSPVPAPPQTPGPLGSGRQLGLVWALDFLLEVTRQHWTAVGAVGVGSTPKGGSPALCTGDEVRDMGLPAHGGRCVGWWRLLRWSRLLSQVCRLSRRGANQSLSELKGGQPGTFRRLPPLSTGKSVAKASAHLCPVWASPSKG